MAIGVEIILVGRVAKVKRGWEGLGILGHGLKGSTTAAFVESLQHKRYTMSPLRPRLEDGSDIFRLGEQEHLRALGTNKIEVMISSVYSIHALQNL